MFPYIGKFCLVTHSPAPMLRAHQNPHQTMPPCCIWLLASVPGLQLLSHPSWFWGFTYMSSTWVAAKAGWRFHLWPHAVLQQGNAVSFPCCGLRCATGPCEWPWSGHWIQADAEMALLRLFTQLLMRKQLRRTKYSVQSQMALRSRAGMLKGPDLTLLPSMAQLLYKLEWVIWFVLIIYYTSCGESTKRVLIFWSIFHFFQVNSVLTREQYEKGSLHVHIMPLQWHA